MKITKFIIPILIIFLAIFAFYIFNKQNKKEEQNENLIPVIVAPDWTPNTNHTGIYVALKKGWYKEAGLDVKILPYSSTATPEVLVTNGKADVGVSATEGVVAASATKNPVVSIAAIIQHNTSGFLALADNGISSPKDFANRIDGGSGSPLETAIVTALIKNDSGTGTFKNVALDVEAMQALESKKVDFVWVFEGWEVIQAKREGHKVVYFPSIQYGVPDYYTPVLITSPTTIKQKPEILQKFMKATSKGYNYAIDHPKEAAQMLIDGAPKGTFPDKELVYASQNFLSTHYVDKGRPWGVQDKTKWHAYPQFMIDAGAALDNKGQPVKKLDFDSLYTNEFLK